MLLDDYRAQWAGEEHDDLRALAREFVEREVKPYQLEWAKNHEVDRDLWRKAGEAGLLCISIPEEYGGGGGDFTHEAVIAEEQARVGDDAWGNAIHSVIVAHYINAYGTEEQKKNWLPKMASGEYVGAIAMTEPSTGSDLQNVSTRARLDGDEWVINGSKTFITNGSQADLVIIVARTNDQPGYKGISLIVAEVQDLPGFERGRVLEKIGTHGQDTRELNFIDMRVPKENILGNDGEGFIQLMQQLPAERLILGVAGAEMAVAGIREAVEYTKQREVFGKTVMDFQNTKFVLAECAADALSAKTMIDYFVTQMVEGKLGADGASMAKMYGSEVQHSVLDRCLQLFGGYGFMMEYPIARMYAGSRVQRIYGGTNEIMKELIGRTFTK